MPLPAITHLAAFLRPLLHEAPPDTDPADMEAARQDLALSNQARIRVLLHVFIGLTALLLAMSWLLWDRAVQDFDSPEPMWRVTWLRVSWIALELACLWALRTQARPGLPAVSRDRLTTLLILANMLMVVALTWILYPYYQSIYAFLLGLFAHAAVVRLELRRGLLVLGLPSALLIGIIIHLDPDGARTASNVVNLFFMAVLALAVMHMLRTAGLRNALQQLVIQRQNAELGRLAMTDGLTRLANRRALDQCLELEWKRAMREDRPLAAIILDIDHFKAFNDTCGHPAGDTCLQLVARCLEGHLRRSGDLAARYGGEEFALLLPGADQDGALAVAEDIRREVMALGHTHPGSPLGCLTVSLGAACCRPSQSPAPASLLEKADRALYRAKAGGRNRVAAADGDAAEEEPARGLVAQPTA